MQNLSADEQVSVTIQIMTLVDSWGLSSAEIIELLALPSKTPARALRRYRENTAFPMTEEVIERIEHLVGITDALRTSYPHNPQMGKVWIRQRSKKFKNQVPLQVILENGLDGIIQVRKFLDCAYDWEENP